MLIGCGDCNPSAACDFKVLAAAITPYGYSGSDGTSNPQTEPVVQGECDNYCPYVYTAANGPFDCSVTTSCDAVTNIVNWIKDQYSGFQNDTTTPWNTFTVGFFQDGDAATPYKVIGPTTSSPGFGAAIYGSNYTVGYSSAALNGSVDGSLCAFAQVVALRISGQLYIVPQPVPGITQPCLESGAERCTAAGSSGSGTYYIPLPPLELCSSPGGADYSVDYAPYQTGNTDSCLPTYPGGSYTNCQQPDPFFGSDPP